MGFNLPPSVRDAKVRKRGVLLSKGLAEITMRGPPSYHGPLTLLLICRSGISKCAEKYRVAGSHIIDSEPWVRLLMKVLHDEQADYWRKTGKPYVHWLRRLSEAQ